MEVFWRTIACYNSAIWIYRLLIIVAGLLLTVVLIKDPHPWIKVGMKLHTVFLYLWIAIAYCAICYDERNYNGALAMFWIVMATIWAWDTITGCTIFERTYKYDMFSYVLLALPFVYPLVSVARGLAFPGITSLVMPYSTTVFTVGLLLLFSRKVSMFLVLFLCHWSLIGLSKTCFFNIPEDFLLAGATVPALYLFFREYFLNNLRADAKLKAKYINWSLILVCISIGILLTMTVFLELVSTQQPQHIFTDKGIPLERSTRVFAG